MNFYKDFIKYAFPLSRDFMMHEFIYEFTLFLQEKFDIPIVKGSPLAAAVGGRMSGANLYYHTPLHILAIFSFAAENNIPLTPAESLALWTHDAICVPLAKDNEEKTAKFIRVLFEGCIPEATLQETEEYIMATAKHLEGDMPVKVALVMDLDICSFAFPDDAHAAVEMLLRQEFLESGCTEEQYLFGRKDFLKKLVAKQFIFRTNYFKNFTFAYERTKKESEK